MGEIDTFQDIDTRFDGDFFEDQDITIQQMPLVNEVYTEEV